jgi:hypothetical protein
MSEKALYTQKLRKAARMLFFKRYRKVGVKGWELKKALGKNYPKIIGMLNDELEKIGLKVKVFSEDGKEEKLSGNRLDKALFFITSSGGLASAETEGSGWRIDDLAVLAVTIAYLNTKNGKASRSEIEKVLKKKLPEWRVDFNLDRFIRMGYLTQDENKVLQIGWRTKAEVDQKTLMELLLVEEEIE